MISCFASVFCPGMPCRAAPARPSVAPAEGNGRRRSRRDKGICRGVAVPMAGRW